MGSVSGEAHAQIWDTSMLGRMFDGYGKGFPPNLLDLDSACTWRLERISLMAIDNLLSMN
jgi:hypothetical protein